MTVMIGSSETVYLRPGTQRAIAYDLMKANPDVSQEDVVALIVKKCNLDRNRATVLYRWCLENGAPGKPENHARRPGSARDIAYKILVANPDADLEEVVPLIERDCNLTRNRARTLYNWCVENGAPGSKKPNQQKLTETGHREGSDKDITVKVMREFADRPMFVTIDELVRRMPHITEKRARAYYSWGVKNGVPGKLLLYVRRDGKALVKHDSETAVETEVIVKMDVPEEVPEQEPEAQPEVVETPPELQAVAAANATRKMRRGTNGKFLTKVELAALEAAEALKSQAA